MAMTKDEIWSILEDLGVSEQTLQIVTDINGYSEDTLYAILYAFTGYRNFSQMKNDPAYADIVADIDDIEACGSIAASTYNRHTPDSVYLYIFKHGIGPGTMPSDVNIVKVKDLPNYYTAVWLDRFLTTDEMKQYDIPFETDINYYLDRIGYCQKDGDVVPCDDVEACDKVTASSTRQPKIPDGWDIVPEGDFDDGRWGCIAKEMPNNSGYYWIDAGEDDRDKLYYTISYAYRTPEGPVGDIIETGKTYYRLSDALKEVDRRITGEFDDVEACDKVTAAKTIRWSQLSGSDQIAVEYAISYLDSNYGGIENVSDDDYLLDAARYGCNIASEGNAEPEYENEDFYMDEPDFDKVFNYLKSKSSCRDITCATDIDDDDEDKIYWVQAYLSKPHKGMIEDFTTNDWDAALDKLVEYANKGYYIAFDNLASGEGYYYDSDEVLEAIDFGDIYTLRRLESLYEGR